MVRDYKPKRPNPEYFDDPDDIAPPPDVDYDTRMERALEIWTTGQASNKPISLREVARLEGVVWETLRNRKMVLYRKKAANQAMQKLTPLEENVLVSYIVVLASWGYPPTHQQLLKMAYELLQAKGDMNPLGHTWIQQFMDRHTKP